MSYISKCLATNLRALRKTRNLTQSDLAKEAGISLIFLQGIETERKWLSPATAKSLAEALQVSEMKLFAEIPEIPKPKKKTKSSAPKELRHVPDDIFYALRTLCQHPEWKWESFRWLLQGYERDIIFKVR